MRNISNTERKLYGNTYPEYLSEISEDGNMGLCRIFGIQYVPL